MKVEIVRTDFHCEACTEASDSNATFRHSPETGMPELVCDCGEVREMTKSERSELLAKFTRWANTLSRHMQR